MRELREVYMVWCRNKNSNNMEWKRVGDFVYASVEWAKADMQERRVEWFDDSPMYGNSREYDYRITEHGIVGAYPKSK